MLKFAQIIDDIHLHILLSKIAQLQQLQRSDAIKRLMNVTKQTGVPLSSSGRSFLSNLANNPALSAPKAPAAAKAITAIKPPAPPDPPKTLSPSAAQKSFARGTGQTSDPRLLFGLI